MSAAISATAAPTSTSPVRPRRSWHSALQGTAAEQQFAPSQLQLLGRVLTPHWLRRVFWLQWPVAGSHHWHRSELYAHIVERDVALQPAAQPLLSAQYHPPPQHPRRTVTGVNLYNASGHLDLTDYGEVRGRAGYVVGNLLPYGFVGFVGGRADYSVSATTDAICIAVANTLIRARNAKVSPNVQRGAKQCAALGLLRRRRT